MAVGDVLNRDCFDGGGTPKKAATWFNKAQGLTVDADGEGTLNGGIIARRAAST